MTDRVVAKHGVAPVSQQGDLVATPIVNGSISLAETQITSP
jgi:hypothetical protein